MGQDASYDSFVCVQYSTMSSYMLGTSLAASEDGSRVVACATGNDYWVPNTLTKITTSGKHPAYLYLHGP
jgi:hypothetical protein